VRNRFELAQCGTDDPLQIVPGPVVAPDNAEKPEPALPGAYMQ